MVQVDARSLELLCEDLGSPVENRAFNGIMHTVLGVAEQARIPADPTQSHIPDPSSSPRVGLTPDRMPISRADPLALLAPSPTPAPTLQPEQVRYCDNAENPTYGMGPNAYDEWKNPINCTWGFHRPPKLPEADGEATCSRDPARLRAERLKMVERHWDNPSYGGFFVRRKQAWSTRDRPAYLHKN